MSTFMSILWQEYVLFKRKFWTITLAAMVSPILYLIAFGWGLGGGLTVEGQSYINFVIPGIIALTTMTVSFSNTSSSVNISRIFYKTFEAFMIAPITVASYSLGKIVAGALMGMYSAFLIISLSLIFRTGLTISPYFVLIVMLNCLVFSAIGFTAGIYIKSHKDMSKFSSFIITPMSFLCGTFFSLEKMPSIIKDIIWLLPLTHTSLGLRSSGEDLISMLIHPVILIIYFMIVFAIGIKGCKTAE
ncbi:ABC transporter permease [Clostridium cochlearium]|uniref:Transport permease protein n=1 Tax=Clostridium cochlearium TaxID=1494 RepID=A0A7Y3XZK4_CLOCO|nr:ABC transporter permease [Clostridium cochlearium]MCR1970763.1 ABC transporter permease [Clostridium cochlearium]NOH16763.1 ABC transporter permease [Clostridium cochlearium]